MLGFFFLTFFGLSVSHSQESLFLDGVKEPLVCQDIPQCKDELSKCNGEFIYHKATGALFKTEKKGPKLFDCLNAYCKGPVKSPISPKFFTNSNAFAQSMDRCGLPETEPLTTWVLNQWLAQGFEMERFLESRTFCGPVTQEGPTLPPLRFPPNSKNECPSQGSAEEWVAEGKDVFLKILQTDLSGLSASAREKMNQDLTGKLRQVTFAALDPSCKDWRKNYSARDLAAPWMVARKLIKNSLGLDKKECEVAFVDQTAAAGDKVKYLFGRPDEVKEENPAFAKNMFDAAKNDNPKRMNEFIRSNRDLALRLVEITQNCDIKDLAIYGHGGPGTLLVAEETLDSITHLASIKDFAPNARISLKGCEVGKNTEENNFGTCYLQDFAQYQLFREKGYGTVEAPLDKMGWSELAGFVIGKSYVSNNGLPPITAPYRNYWRTITVRNVGGKMKLQDQESIDPLER